MHTTSTDGSGRARQVSRTAADGPRVPAAEGQHDASGFLFIEPLDPPICLPVLPRYPEIPRATEPLGGLRQRQVNP